VERLERARSNGREDRRQGLDDLRVIPDLEVECPVDPTWIRRARGAHDGRVQGAAPSASVRSGTLVIGAMRCA
jgi:hypothetical protein